MQSPQIIHGLLKPRTLYISDLDGTLLDTSSSISTASAHMLNQAIAQGVLFSIATARTPATVVPLMSNVDMRLPGIVMTGAAMYDLSRREFSRLQFLPGGIAHRLVELYRAYGVATFIYTYTGNKLVVYHIGELNEYERSFIIQRTHTGIKTFDVPENGESLLPDNLDNTVLLYSLQPWDAAEALYMRIKTDKMPVTAMCYNDIYGPEWAQLEMFGPNANKADAVEALASMIRADRIVAFGDNVNDLSLFGIADERIAVGNAVAQLKERATMIIDSNETPAVASFILKHSRTAWAS